jgi:hypothetical protein
MIEQKAIDPIGLEPAPRPIIGFQHDDVQARLDQRPSSG